MDFEELVLLTPPCCMLRLPLAFGAVPSPFERCIDIGLGFRFGFFHMGWRPTLFPYYGGRACRKTEGSWNRGRVSLTVSDRCVGSVNVAQNEDSLNSGPFSDSDGCTWGWAPQCSRSLAGGLRACKNGTEIRAAVRLRFLQVGLGPAMFP